MALISLISPHGTRSKDRPRPHFLPLIEERNAALRFCCQMFLIRDEKQASLNEQHRYTNKNSRCYFMNSKQRPVSGRGVLAPSTLGKLVVLVSWSYSLRIRQICLLRTEMIDNRTDGRCRRWWNVGTMMGTFTDYLISPKQLCDR